MKQELRYGRIRWSYEDDSSFPVFPTPLMTFTPIKLNGKLKYPQFTDKTIIALFKLKTKKQFPFREVYKEWFTSWTQDQELGEGRAFLRWLIKNQFSISWKNTDYSLHRYFQDKDSPRHDPHDEMSIGLSFAIKPVDVENRRVKLYLQDEAVLNLLSLPYGEEKNFLDLVESYVKQRFLWEEWRAPAPPFLDWVKAQGKKPIFSKGQLGFHPGIANA